MFLLSAVFAGLPAEAHELLPKVLVEYMNEHPDATPEEIQAFVTNNAPEFIEKYSDKEDVVRLIRNQSTNVWDNMWDFLKLGVGHILSGADHILFVISLLLVFVSLREILKLTITFTIAHSITLILAGLGILTLSTRITEPLIALSIAYVAFTTVFLGYRQVFSSTKAKVATVFFFGLFHGLGFAGLLEEIHIPEENLVSSLFSFNIGIEIGQLVIVAIALPLILWARHKKWYPTLIKILAIIITVLGVGWAVQRVIG
jgi:hydrogenase/urease accessory protein HupE